jgi:hypothetical protein
MIQLEIVLIMISLVGGLGYMLGSYVSPITKHLKNHIRFLEGKVNRYKQDVKEEQNEKKDAIDEIIDNTPMLKAAVTAAGGKEKAIEMLMNKFLGNNNKSPSGQEWR